MDSDSGAEEITAPPSPLDENTRAYFDKLVPHRVFIQNGDTFLGKYLIKHFKDKTFIQLHEDESQQVSVAPSSSAESLELLVSSFMSQAEELDENIEQQRVPSAVFHGFVKPDNVRAEDDQQFWDHQMLGEFRMDRISNEDYEHVLSLASRKECKAFLYSLLRKQRHEEELKNKEENQIVADETEHEEGEEDFEEIPYEIFTLLKNQDSEVDPRFTHLQDVKIINLSDMDQITTCGTVIFDLFTSSETELTDQIDDIVKQILPNFGFDPSITPRGQNVIIVSNLMTWVNTKVLKDNTGEPKPLGERRLKKRKAHPDYEHVLDLENYWLDVRKEMKKKNKKFQLHVVASGIPYGFEEDIFYHWFGLGYHNDALTTLPIFGPGDNIVPTIHIDELVRVIDMIADTPATVKKAYCLAVENETNTLADILKAISKMFTPNGDVEYEPIETFEPTFPIDLVYNLNQKKTALDLLQAHLPVQSDFLEEYGPDMELQERNFVIFIRATMKEFLRSHNLVPIKILIHGPRLTGKTELARKLANYYGLKYLNPEDLLESRKSYLRKEIEHWNYQIELLNLKHPNENEHPENVSGMLDVKTITSQASIHEDNDETTLEELKSQKAAHLEELKKLGILNKKKNKAFYEEVVTKLYLETMSSNQVLYHGYVMDGWPDTFQMCNQFFSTDENVESDEESKSLDEDPDEDLEDLYSTLNRALLPDIVISLEASQDWTVTRFMSFVHDHPDLFLPKSPHPPIPEDVTSTDMLFISSSHMIILGENENEEDEDTRRLREFIEEYQQFRKNNAYPYGFSQFFNEISLFPLVFNVEEHSPDQIWENLVARIGKPRVLLGEAYRLELEDKRRQEALDFELFQECLRQMLEKERQDDLYRMEQWAGMNNILHNERNIIQDLHNMPLRHYLMKYVLPLVTRGMNDVAKTNPDCPIDYLGEYFFKENPNFQVFNVHYHNKAEDFFNLLCAMKLKLKEM